MHICRALLAHGYSLFSLTILNYVNISNCSTDEAKTKILQCEQFFIDTLLPKYNIASTAGSLLGFKHTEKSKALISIVIKGKIHTEETIAKISIAKSGKNNHWYGKTGEKNPFYSKTYSAETKAKN